MVRTLSLLVAIGMFATGFIGCGGGGGGGSSSVSSPSAQRITVTVQFPTDRSRAHDTIASAWLTVTGDNMSAIVQEMILDPSTDSATTTVSVPVGTNRMFRVDAKTAADTIVYTGESSGVQVVAGETVQVALTMATATGTASVVITQFLTNADSFDAETTGAHPGNWTVSEINPPASTISTNETVFFTDSSNTSGKSIEFIDTRNADFSSMTRSTHDAWEKVAFEWAQKADDINGHLECVFIGPEGEAGSIAFSPETLAGRIVLTTTGNSVEDIAQWEVGPWYTVRVELDTDADTYSRVYLHGILVATDVAFRTAVSSITGVMFRTGTTTSSPEGTARYIDNFKEYVLTGQAGNGGTTAVIDYTKLMLSRTLSGYGNMVDSVAFSPDGTILANGSGNNVELWDVQTGALLRTFTGHEQWVSSVAFSPDGATLASGSYDNTVKLWDTQTGATKLTFTLHSDDVRSVAFSPDGSTVASGSMDDIVELWDAMTGATKLSLDHEGPKPLSVALSPDGSTGASGCSDATVFLWDVQTGALNFTLTGHASVVGSVAFSPDGRTLASGSTDSTVKLWDVQTGVLNQTLVGHGAWVGSVAFAPNGSTVASGSGDSTVKLWNAQTGALLRTLTGNEDYFSPVAFSPDGSTLACVSGVIGLSNDSIQLWRVP